MSIKYLVESADLTEDIDDVRARDGRSNVGTYVLSNMYMYIPRKREYRSRLYNSPV